VTSRRLQHERVRVIHAVAMALVVLAAPAASAQDRPFV
jgi:hypothetical protein